jgi:diguanylate cyclase (GGDEF)-like protein
MSSIKDPSPPLSIPARYSQRLLASIRRLHDQYHRSGAQDLFVVLVEELLQLTGSPHGGGGEVLDSEHGKARFELRAAVYPRDVPPDWLDRAYHAVLADGQACRVKELPSTGLGLPIFCGAELMAVAAVAGRADGYGPKTSRLLAPLLQSFGALIAAHRASLKCERLCAELQREIAGRRHLETTLQDRVAKDGTERQRAQERLHYLAYHDGLTELPNRSLFMEGLNHVLAVNGRRVGVICLDVDRFKIINDTLGHDLGDRVLLAVAQLLKGCLAKGDTAARIGGDKFAVRMDSVASSADAVNRIRRILESVARPLRVDDHELYITIGIGAALAPEDGADANTLLKNADAALYRAKQQGRHTYQFYSSDLNDKAFKQLRLETRLYRAMERREFHLCYQPQVDLSAGRITGLEALLRWRHPELGEVSPLEFIPLLEDTGLIVPVGEWVLHSACEEAVRWQALHGAPLRLSVNLSGRQFCDPHLHATVQRILGDSGLAPSQLEVEITESVFMQNNRASAANLDALQALGVRLAIDDFGTGYSALGYLKRFPVDTLKIDRTFIHDVIRSPDDETIIKAIIAMAQSLKVETVAEGVETVDQLRLLRHCGCHTMQGFLLSEPMAAADLPAFLGRPLALA